MDGMEIDKRPDGALFAATIDEVISRLLLWVRQAPDDARDQAMTATCDALRQGLIVAVKGAGVLKASGLGGVPLMLGFVLISAFINLFMGSASAKWAVMAPVFVPMLMLLGYTPELTQAAYRIGDSTSNVIAPMMSYFALIVAFFERYDKKSGIGTVVATMLPYTIAFLAVWSALLIGWMLAGLPVGPGAVLRLPS